MPNLLGPGEAGVLVGDQQNNRVTVQAPSGNGDQYAAVSTLAVPRPRRRQGSRPATSSGRSSTRAPALPDAIVVSTGSNAIEVYRTIVDRERRAHLRPVAADCISSAPPRPASPWPTSMATAFPTCWSPTRGATTSR